jgi:GT2 family glycosyltransferase
MPKVSIVLSVYNGASTLADALETALIQSWEDWELIAINDGSTDDSPALLTHYAERDGRVRLLHHRHNRGLAHALNHGVHAAQGEYIMRMDHDDLNLRDRMKLQLELMETHRDVGVASCFVDPLFSTDVSPTDRAFLLAWELTRRPLAATPDRIPALLPSRCVFHHGEVMFRKQVWIEAGGYRPELTLAEDYDLWLRLVGRTKFRILPQTLYLRRFGAGNSTHLLANMHHFASGLARRCFELRHAGHDDTTYARTQMQTFLRQHGLTERFSHLWDAPAAVDQP